MAALGKFGLWLAAACVLGAAACQPAAEAPQSAPADSAAALPAGCILQKEGDEALPIGGPIALVDQSGTAVTQANFRDGPTLVYFGYTFCPDVCPLALQLEKAALDKLGSQAQIIQPVLITLDPARDTPEALAAYVQSEGFPSGLTGLTGDAKQIEAAASAFRVSWKRDADPGSAGAYTLSHTSFFYLMDEEWRLLGLFPSKSTPNEAAQCLKAALAEAGGD
ncbi:MAG: SCO family protein [Hyphomonadaceae bacterium]